MTRTGNSYEERVIAEKHLDLANKCAYEFDSCIYADLESLIIQTGKLQTRIGFKLDCLCPKLYAIFEPVISRHLFGEYLRFDPNTEYCTNMCNVDASNLLEPHLKTIIPEINMIESYGVKSGMLTDNSMPKYIQMNTSMIRSNESEIEIFTCSQDKCNKFKLGYYIGCKYKRGFKTTTITSKATTKRDDNDFWYTQPINDATNSLSIKNDLFNLMITIAIIICL